MLASRSRGCLGLLVVTLLLLIAVLLWDCFHGWRQTFANPGAPPAGVLQGQRIPWRVLDRAPMSYVRGLVLGEQGVLGGLVAGDFDADADQELLLISRRRGRVYDADGSRRPAGIHGDGFLMQVSSWDYDGDGTDEAIPEPLLFNVFSRKGRSAQSALPSTTPVVTLANAQVANLAGTPGATDNALVGDYDGDGSDELWLFEGDNLLVYGVGGKQAAKLKLTGWNMGSAIGDIDGDSLDELVAQIAKPRELVAIGKDQPRTVIGSWSSMDGSLNCADVSGDGKAELISGASGYYNCGSGAFVPLMMPSSALGSNMPLTKPVAGDFDGDGDTEIATVSTGIPFGSGVLLFDSTGTCEYYEEFGDIVWSVAALESGGKDYLVVHLTTRLLIYP